MTTFINKTIWLIDNIILVLTTQSGVEMETLPHQDGTVKSMQQILYAKQRPNRIPKTHSVLWPMLVEGSILSHFYHIYRVDIKLT